MSEKSFENYVCWTQQKLSSIVNVEALSIERPVFLATHIPFDKIIYLDSPQNISDTSEERLLDELVERGRNDEHTFLVVQGMAGSGKSHLIRWLYERYMALSSPDDEVVMLIERANSSLRQTLLQIIQHDQFDSTRFTDQIDRIKKATSQLSDDALGDTLLHWLSVGSKENPDIDIVMEKAGRHRKRIDPYVADFLLNPRVREHLKRDGGPIERLIRHLSSGKHSTELDSEYNPIFEAIDFEFEPNQLRDIKEGGYEATQMLADYVSRKDVGRQYLAAYLNAQIGYAIQQTTQISVDDLKSLFFELRKELKAQGKSLVLMVEDISVFTGLDKGLVDVMVTQHTGGDMQKSLCRMTSVVGVTDAHYKDEFQDNIKQRIKHRITLNADSTGASRSTNLFNDIGDMAKFVSRYFNLLRMPQSDFDKWIKEDCEPTALPSACTGCEFRERCHLAFGYVALDGVNDERDVGLYPFNRNLLTVIRSNLDTMERSKTPRSLLQLIEYMLGHAPAIRNGTFPDEKPLPDLKPIRFDHFNYIRANTRKDADRLERFMMYWGDGSVDEATLDGIKTIGGIPTYAYEAFGLPLIGGQKTPPKDSPPVSSISKPKPTAIEDEETTAPVVDYKDDVFESIHRWRRGDGVLEFHADIKRAWYRYLRNRIDWDHHHVTHTQLEKFKAPQLVIEDQGTRAQGNLLYFERSDELAEFFEALTQIEKYYSELPPEKLSHYLLILEQWLDQYETTIVRYVKTPYRKGDSPPNIEMELDQLLFENNVFFAMLGGDLQPSSKTGSYLVEALARQPEAFNGIWRKPISELRTEHGRSSEWIDAIKWGSSRNRVHEQREQFLQMLNRPQGGRRKEAKFIDAPYLLELINQLNRRKWAIDTKILLEFDSTHQTYQEWLLAYQYLQVHGEAILSADENHVRYTLSKLRSLTGDHTPSEVFEAINATVEALKDAGRTFRSFKIPEELTARKLHNRIDTLESVQSKESHKEKILAYSSIYHDVREVWEYIDLFDNYAGLLETQIKQVEEELDDAGESHLVIDPGENVESEYRKILASLASVLPAEEPEVEVIG